MATRPELDPDAGAFRWAYTRARFDHPRTVLAGFVVFPLAAAVVSAVAAPNPGSPLHVRVEAGIYAGLITLGVVALLIVIVALLFATREQRNALRKEAEGRDLTIAEREEEIATLRSERLDSDHEQGIEATLGRFKNRL